MKRKRLATSASSRRRNRNAAKALAEQSALPQKTRRHRYACTRRLCFARAPNVCARSPCSHAACTASRACSWLAREHTPFTLGARADLPELFAFSARGLSRCGARFSRHGSLGSDRSAHAHLARLEREHRSGVSLRRGVFSEVESTRTGLGARSSDRGGARDEYLSPLVYVGGD